MSGCSDGSVGFARLGPMILGRSRVDSRPFHRWCKRCVHLRRPNRPQGRSLVPELRSLRMTVSSGQSLIFQNTVGPPGFLILGPPPCGTSDAVVLRLLAAREDAGSGAYRAVPSGAVAISIRCAYGSPGTVPSWRYHAPRSPPLAWPSEDMSGSQSSRPSAADCCRRTGKCSPSMSSTEARAVKALVLIAAWTRPPASRTGTASVRIPSSSSSSVIE